MICANYLMLECVHTQSQLHTHIISYSCNVTLYTMARVSSGYTHFCKVGVATQTAVCSKCGEALPCTKVSIILACISTVSP